MTHMLRQCMLSCCSRVPQLAQAIFLANAKDFGSALNFLQKMHEPGS